MPDTSAPYLPPLDDLQRCGADDLLLQPTAASDYFEMENRLFAAVEIAQASNDEAKAAALRLLGRVCSMMLVPDDRATPFKPQMTSATGLRTMIPEDLTSADIDVLADFAPTVQHSLLRARLCDLVWFKNRRKGIAFPRMAIDSYRTHTIDFNTWHLSGAAAWHRALQLAVSLRAGAENRAADIEAALVAACDRSLGADTFEPMFYIRPLYAEKRGAEHAPRIAGEFERIGQERLAADRPTDAEHFFEEAERWYARADLPDKQAEMLVLVGSSLAAQAESRTSAIARQEFFTRAIKAYRDVQSSHRAQYQIEEIVAELRGKLASAGRLALGEMHVIQGPTIDLTQFMQRAVQRVQGKTPINALLAFCTLHPFPRRDVLFEQAQALVAQSLVGRIFGGVTFAADGRAIARRAGADSDPAAEAALVFARATKACCEIAAMTAYGMVQPALEAMQLECYLTLFDFAHLAANASIVPRDRVDVVAQGLHAGYAGDYVQAIHILIPQFEYMVRVVLQDAGAHTTTHNTDGTDTEAGLSTLVQRPQMIEVFGNDLTFTIRSIMCEQSGPNLRNAVAHGMADRSLCEGQHGVYAWWLILRLIVVAYVVDLDPQQPDAPVAAASSPEQPQQG